jgi:hypothetical protein
VSVVRPDAVAAFTRTISRYPNATVVGGLGDKAVFDKHIGTLALVGNAVIDAFVPQGSLSEAQTSAIEKSLILALRSKL